MNNLAFLYSSQWKYIESEQLYLECYKLRKEILGNNHPDTLTTMNNLAELYSKQGKYLESEELLIECLKLRKEMLGESHPDTLKTMNNLSELCEMKNSCFWFYFDLKFEVKKKLWMVKWKKWKLFGKCFNFIFI